MKAKWLNSQEIRLSQAATGISPADYPLGSLESRAAVRALLDRADRMKPHASQYDSDVRMIYGRIHWLSNRTDPSRSVIESTNAYRRGREVEERLLEPISCGSDDASRQRQVERIIEKVVGIRLEYPPEIRDDVIRYWSNRILLSLFEQSWKRQLPDLTFPIRVDENHSLLIRRPGGEWLPADGREVDLILGPLKKIRQWERQCVHDSASGKLSDLGHSDSARLRACQTANNSH